MQSQEKLMKDLIQSILEKTKQLNPQHYATLMGERTSGSRWGIEITAEILASAKWRKLARSEYQEGLHLPFCDYYVIDDEGDMRAAFPHAQQCMETFSEMAARAESYAVLGEQCPVLHLVEAVKGDHGWELRATQSHHVQTRHATTAWLIVGPAEDANDNTIEGEQMVWTIYPGEITARLPQDFDGDVSKLDSRVDYAVKGVAKIALASQVGTAPGGSGQSSG